MKNINVNELQDQASKLVKEVERGEKYQVNRYSKPVAVVLSVEEYESLVGHNCKDCINDLRRIAQGVKNNCERCKFDEE